MFTKLVDYLLLPSCQNLFKSISREYSARILCGAATDASARPNVLKADWLQNLCCHDVRTEVVNKDFGPMSVGRLLLSRAALFTPAFKLVVCE